MMFMPRLVLNLVLSVLLGVLCSARAASIALNPMQDTFISEAIETPNGAGADMVIGSQGSMATFAKNRGLLRFDLSSIPAGAVVSSANLRLTVTRVPATPANPNFELHRLLLP